MSEFRSGARHEGDYPPSEELITAIQGCFAHMPEAVGASYADMIHSLGRLMGNLKLLDQLHPDVNIADIQSLSISNGAFVWFMPRLPNPKLYSPQDYEIRLNGKRKPYYAVPFYEPNMERAADYLFNNWQIDPEERRSIWEPPQFSFNAYMDRLSRTGLVRAIAGTPLARSEMANLS